MPSLSERLKQLPLRDHLLASGLALLIFLFLFFKAVFGDYIYGALPQQQLMGVIWQNPWIAQPQLPVTERQPNVIDPDYHFLYELDSDAAARELRAGRLPFFDVGRMLGVPLWGSIIFDFGNPLNLLLKWFSSQNVHLIKVLFCMLLAANGFVILTRELGSTSPVSWIIATCLYLGTNYSLYYMHWIGAYGITCIAPLLIGFILRFLRSGQPGAFLGVFGSVCWVVLSHCTHIGVHLMILSTVTVVVAMLVDRKEWRRQLPRLALLGFACFCAAVTCSEVLRQVQITASDSSRLSAGIEPLNYPYKDFPRVREAYSMLFFCNIDLNGSYWETIYVPWPAIVALLAVFGAGGTFVWGIRIIGWVAAYYVVYYFFGWIDAPFITYMGRLYAPNPLWTRGLLDFYLPTLTLAAIATEAALRNGLGKRTKICAIIGLFIIAILVYVAVIVERSDVRGAFFASTGPFYDSLIHSAAFWLVLGGNALWLCALLFRGMERRWMLAALGSFIVCFGIGNGRIPFYQRKDVGHISHGDPADINTPRIARVLPRYEVVLGAANIEMRYTLDSPLSTMGLKMLHGYHTSMSKPELAVFDSMMSDAYLQKRPEGTVLRSFSFGYYRTFLDGQGIVQSNAVRTDKLLLLKLLGVDYLVDGASLTRVGPDAAFDFSRWPGINLQATTVSHFIEGASRKDIVAAFSGALDSGSVSNMLGKLKPITLQPTKEGGYTLNWSGGSGVLVIPYHFGRFFSVRLDGKEITEPEQFGLCVVEVTPQSKVLEIQPKNKGIVARTMGGIVIGCLLAVLGCWICVRIGKPEMPAPVEAERAEAVAGKRQKA